MTEYHEQQQLSTQDNSGNFWVASMSIKYLARGDGWGGVGN